MPSLLAWCYVIYLRTVTSDNTIHVAFICGNNKVLPKGVSVKGQLSIPRAELNAAMDLAKKVLEVENELNMPNLHPTIYYSDSQDVLAWVKNDSTNEAPKRYIVNRINTIRKMSNPDQWQYIPTKLNPADIGTRPVSVSELQASCWLSGPAFLLLEDPKPPSTPQMDNSTLFTSILEPLYDAHPSSYFHTQIRHATEDITSGSMWEQLLEATIQQHKMPNQLEASISLQKEMQREAWPKGLDTINKLEPKKRQEITSKSPFLDISDGLIKVGGRLSQADLSFGRKHPTLIPDNIKGDALIGYIHAKTPHQGRKITSSAIREAGFWPVGSRRRIGRIVSTCVPCRALRAPLMNQKMADLPEHRLNKTPPFYHCGIDVFGYFFIKHGKATRANPGGRQKVWVLLF